jgi:DDE superfamily endonuclease
MVWHHPNIIMHYVPAGCTGVFQPCDVGIQRVFKHSLKRSYHQDVVTEILDQIDSGNETIIVEKKLGVLRDRSVGWLWDAYETLKNEQTVKKVFG